MEKDYPTRIEKVKRRIEQWQLNKKKLLDFADRYEAMLSKGEITEVEYNTVVDTTLKHISLGEWVRIHNDNIRNGYKALNELQKKKSDEDRVKGAEVMSLILVLIVTFGGLYFSQPGITGRVTGPGSEEAATIAVDLLFNESGTYAMDINGTITSVRISGEIIGNGTADVYLGDLLVYSSQHDEASSGSGSGITGMVIGEPAVQDSSAPAQENATPEPDAQAPIESPAPSPEENASILAPGPEEPAAAAPANETVNETIPLEENITIDDTASLLNASENITETPANPPVNMTLGQNESSSNGTDAAESMLPESITIFTAKCIDTCSIQGGTDIKELRISLSDARIRITSISYTYLLPNETEIPENLTGEDMPQNISAMPILNETQNESIGLGLNVTNASITVNETINATLNGTYNMTLNLTLNETLNQTLNQSLNMTINETLNESLNLSELIPLNITLNESLNMSANLSMNSTLDVNMSGVPMLLYPIPNSSIIAFGGYYYVKISGYFSDSDNLTLFYRYVPLYDNSTPVQAELSGDEFSLRSLSNFTGDLAFYFIADDGLHQVSSNIVTLNVHEENAPPVMTTPLPDLYMAANSSITLNLSGHFTDPEGRELEYTPVYVQNAAIAVSGDLATITTEPSYIGTTYAAFFANDSMNITASNIFAINIVENLGLAYMQNLMAIYKSFFEQSRLMVTGVSIESNGYSLALQQDKPEPSSAWISGIANLSDVTTVFFGDSGDPRMLTDAFGAGSLTVSNATIYLAKSGYVNTLFACEIFDQESRRCRQWMELETPFLQNGTGIQFTINDSRMYAGGRVIPSEKPYLISSSMSSNNYCPRCAEKFNCAPENFCPVFNHWVERTVQEAQFDFDILGLNPSFQKAEFCAYAYYFWEGDAPTNYVRAIPLSTCANATRLDEVAPGWSSARIGQLDAWNCIDVTTLVRDTLLSGRSNMFLAWTGDNANGEHGPFACFSGYSIPDGCSLPDSQATDCRPFINITYAK